MAKESDTRTILKKGLSILFLIVMYCMTSDSSAQTDTIINGRRYKIVDETTDTTTKTAEVKEPAREPAKIKEPKQKKYVPPMDSTFVLNNKKLSYYNNWFTVGGGVQQNLTYKRKPGFTGGLDFNFHIKQHYFQLGALLSGEQFGFYDNYQFHLGYGKRYEDRDIHFAGFACLSYSTGYGLVGDTVYTRPFNQPGLYVQLEGVKKLTYDVGVGASFWVDYNPEQGIFGARIILYFSGAYRGKRFNDGKTIE